jgi:hypothetical protein
MTHVEFITSLTHRVRLVGAVAALDELRANQTTIISPTGTVGHHDTLAVFFVWAVDRLVAAGLDDVQVLWHPLTDVRTPLSWWDADTLESHEAANHFVPSNLVGTGEPAPMVDTRVLTAA